MSPEKIVLDFLARHLDGEGEILRHRGAALQVASAQRRRVTDRRAELCGGPASTELGMHDPMQLAVERRRERAAVEHRQVVRVAPVARRTELLPDALVERRPR